ncbi:hypothetical protein IMCC20628_02138 [Hoeflea sp. IMCC20628]|uniref:hypothetical protein n=1 Tax=Hoeflea sp. IMCC20628 TaxID=1620421 RepID=UPI00063AD4E8|nr:hypothetical protein [Hoeflea sp. IMCC20628]AKI00842.1 hypothetical protein IMCC20628_02138 [Hoeflea sp. IMCC20628]
MELPLGGELLDTYNYIDGAYRLSVGQQIYTDIHAPVGPLNYLLFDLLSSLFPHGNVALTIQWCRMLITVPMFAVICWFALERGPVGAFALLLPFLLFSILPLNIMSWNAFPGVEGFAYYNRHSAVLLYLLVATLFFVRSHPTLIGLISALLLTLAFIKMNGFAVAGLILAMAVVSHRIGVATSMIIAAICLGLVAGLELLSGSVSAYLQSVMRLFANNEMVLLSNLVTTVSARFDVIFAATLLSAYLFACRYWGGSNLLAVFDSDHPLTPSPNRLDQDWLWLLALIIADALFESQNFGGAAFVSVWPFLLVLFLATAPQRRAQLSPLIVLIALVSLPTVTKMLHSTARAAATSVRDASIETENLPPSMSFSAKVLTVEAAEKARPVMAEGRDTYEGYARFNILPTYWLYFDHRFQVTVLKTMDEVIEAIREREARLDRHYEVIDLRDFANPIAAVMGRTPAKGVSIGGDPYRTVLPLTGEEAEALSQTDIVLLPTCPVTAARKKLLSDYQSAYAGFSG